MATVTVYDFVRMTCAPLQSDTPTNTSKKITFYSYRGPGAPQFPNLRAADTDGDGQLDFVIGVSDASYRKFLKLDDSMFAPGSQNSPTLWGDPVHVARRALQLQCQMIKDDRTIYYWSFAVPPVAGIGMIVLGAIIFKAPVGAMVVAVSPVAVASGLLVLAGLLIIHGGFMYFGSKLDTLESQFYNSLNALFPLAVGG